MKNIKSNIIIDCSVEAVFDLVSDFHNDWKWRKKRIDYQYISLPHIINTKTQNYFPWLKKEISNGYRLIDFSVNNYVVYEITFGNVFIRDIRHTEGLQDNKVNFEHKINIEVSGILKPICKTFFNTIEKDFIHDLFWLKEMIEKIKPKLSYVHNDISISTFKYS